GPDGRWLLRVVAEALRELDSPGELARHAHGDVHVGGTRGHGPRTRRVEGERTGGVDHAALESLAARPRGDVDLAAGPQPAERERPVRGHLGSSMVAELWIFVRCRGLAHLDVF